MERPISSGSKVLFLVHAIVGAILGLVYLLIPTTFGTAVAWPVADPTAIRVIAAAVLGLALGSALAYRATAWGSVKILVQVEVVFTGLGALAILWGLLFEGYPRFHWSSVVMLAAFAIAFGFFYRRQEAAGRAIASSLA